MLVSHMYNLSNNFKPKAGIRQLQILTKTHPIKTHVDRWIHTDNDYRLTKTHPFNLQNNYIVTNGQLDTKTMRHIKRHKQETMGVCVYTRTLENTY